jgi:hypothetical protein
MFLNKSLTMTYFHTGTRTIIGAKAFHCPVRDGKEWYHLAMVIRLNWLTGCCIATSSLPNLEMRMISFILHHWSAQT